MVTTVIFSHRDRRLSIKTRAQDHLFKAHMKLPALLLLCFAPMPAFADGWTFVHGRFPEGRVTVFRLTKAQRAYLDLVRRCHTDNEKTPYLFRLTTQQSKILTREVGFSPDRFAIFESYRGDEGVDLEMNVINRFSEEEFEVPHKLLVRDAVAHEWEQSTMGWLSNPLFDANPANIKAGSCPK